MALFDEFPPLTQEQLRVLDKIFPDRPTNEDTPVNTIFYRAGQANVVRWLREQALKKSKLPGV